MVEIIRVEHTGHVMKDPISYYKVFRSGPKAIFSNFAGGTKTRDVPTGLQKWPHRGGSKARGKVELAEIMVSSVLFTLETSGQRELGQLPAGL